MTQIPPGGSAGMADLSSEAFVGSVELFAGDTPRPSTRSYLVDATLIGAADLPEFSVVGLSSGALVMAKTSSTAVVPIGVTCARAKMGATDKHVPVFHMGCFNLDALNWHADYDTDAKKIAAFDGSPSPTVVTIKKLKYAGITTNP